MSSQGFRKKESYEFDNPNNYKIFKNQEIPEAGINFIDPLFPPNDNSLLGKTPEGKFIDAEIGKNPIIDPKEIEWKRASEIFPEPQIFEGIISIDDLKQGKIGNCYFLSALAAMCEFPRLISDIILTKQTSDDGIYQVLMFIDGEHQIVFLDDYFPCIKGTNVLYFAKPNSFELWTLLLEKAWAKVNGGYANIVSGWASEVFRAFTSFPCEKIIHKEEKIDRAWGIIRAVDLNNGIICSSTKNDDSVENKGLIKNHTYTLIDTEEVVDDKGKTVRLCKLRNPWGYRVWNREWSKGSPLWTDGIKKQIDEKYLNEEKGTFWMSIEDINKYFIRTDLCQIIYDANVKFYDLNENDLKDPQVFNIHVEKEGLLSVSFMEKNWRYNRELRNKPHPTSLIFAEYDPSMKTINHAFTDFDCYNNVEKTRRVRPGFYILWVFKSLDACEEPKPTEAKLRVCCDVPFGIKQIGPDKDLGIISEIIYLGVQHHHPQRMKKDEFYYEIKNSFARSGIAYRLIINPLSTKYEEWENDASKVQGIMLLPPFQGQNTFNLTVQPNSYGIILGIKKDSYGDYWFNIISKIKQYECKEDENPTSTIKPNFNDFCTDDVSSMDLSPDFKYPSLEELSIVDKYREIDHHKYWENKLNEKYPELMEKILDLKPIDNDKPLEWVEIKTGNGLYIGEANNTTRNGRGAYIYDNENVVYIGYWEDNKKEKYGKLYENNYKDLKLIYEGEYKNDKRDGNGIYYYKTGEVYDGKWKNGLREGRGTFTWGDGSKWEGNFHHNEMDGNGMFYDNGKVEPIAYIHGQQIPK